MLQEIIQIQLQRAAEDKAKEMQGVFYNENVQNNLVEAYIAGSNWHSTFTSMRKHVNSYTLYRSAAIKEYTKKHNIHCPYTREVVGAAFLLGTRWMQDKEESLNSIKEKLYNDLQLLQEELGM